MKFYVCNVCGKVDSIIVSGAQKDNGIFLSYVDSTFYMDIQSQLCEPLGDIAHPHCHMYSVVVETSVFLGRP